MNLTYDAAGLIPAIAQDARTGRVLMLAWMNAEAVERTLASGDAWYWSRSRAQFWKKGESSGHTQRVVDVRTDCDRDAILLLVEQQGPACHTDAPSCFFRSLGDADDSPPPATIVERLAGILRQRASAPPDSSYTAKLLHAGMPKIIAKIDEESGELRDALDHETDERVVSEAADLLYHVLVGFEARGIDPLRVAFELAKRFGTSGIVEKASRQK